MALWAILYPSSIDMIMLTCDLQFMRERERLWVGFKLGLRLGLE
jgi:hypothetical protein